MGAIKTRDCDHGVAATNSPTFAGTGPTCRGGGSGRHGAGSVPSEGWISPAGAMPSTNLPTARGRGATPHTHLVARWLRLRATGREVARLQRGIPPAFIPTPHSHQPHPGDGAVGAPTPPSPPTGHAWPPATQPSWPQRGSQASKRGWVARIQGQAHPPPGRAGGQQRLRDTCPSPTERGASCPPYKRIPGRPPAAPLAGAAPLKRERHRDPREGAAR